MNFTKKTFLYIISKAYFRQNLLKLRAKSDFMFPFREKVVPLQTH